MEIRHDTLYRDVFAALQHMRPGEEAKLIAAAAAYHLGEGGWWGIEVGAFVKATRGDFADLGVEMDNNITCYGFYLVKGFGAFVDEFLKVAKNTTPPATPGEAGLTAGCYQIQLDEAMLVFCRRYFGLRSFHEAEHITLSEWLIARRDEYNRIICERNSMKKYKK